jgi:hypothetical protein
LLITSAAWIDADSALDDAHRHATLDRDVVHRRIENVAADIVEVNVDAFRAKLFQSRADVLVLVVDRQVQALGR